MIRFEVTEEEQGERLDKVLAHRALGHSRSQFQHWIESGRVTVNDVVATSRTRLRVGAWVCVVPEESRPTTIVPEDIPLDVVWQDEHILVLHKPAGLVVHPAAGNWSGTLVHALAHHHSIEDVQHADRPGIVHRLDKDTSGVMVVAKTPRAREGLVPQFRAHSIERRYVAIVVGRPPDHATYDTLHGRHPKDRKKFSSRVREGKTARTDMRVLEHLHGSALVECVLHTGRTHQIRVHLADHGFPILADRVYGRATADPRLRQAATELGRHALHAQVLGFSHPVTGEPMRFSVPPPGEFVRAWQALQTPGGHSTG